MRWVVRFLLSLLVLVALGVGALMFVPGDRIAAVAERRFEEATGRGVSLGGDVQAMIYPRLGIQIGGLEVDNAPWSDTGPMLQADGVRVGVDLLALLGGEVRISEVEVISPELRLEVSPEGQANWDFDTGAGDAAQVGGNVTGAIPAFSLDLGRVSDGRVSYVNRASGFEGELDALEMELRLPAFTGPADLTLSAQVNGQAQAVTAQVARFDIFLGGGVSDIQTALTTGGSSIRFEGRGGYAPLAFTGKLAADLSDMGAVFASLGQDAPAVPRGLGQVAEFNGDVTWTAERTAHLRNGVLRLDQNRLNGEADVDLTGAVPRLNAQLSTDTMDLSAMAAGETGQSGATSAGWSKTPIAAGWLSALDGEIAFRAGAVDLGTLKLGATRVLAKIDSARAVVELREVSAYGGQVTGQFVMNNRNNLSVGGDLRARGLAMQPLLRDLANYERLIGTGDLEISFLGLGNSLDAIMNSLSGKGAFLLGQGELRGLDLVGMLRNLDASYEGEGAKTIFNSVGATFAIEGGVLTNDDLSFRAPLASATGAGEVGIGAQTFNYRVVPVALAGEDGSGGLSVPVLITGTWADPKFRPDLQFLLDAELEGERRALEERLRQSAEDALDVTIEEGESAEDAIKRRIEEEAADQLRRLFGGD